MGNMLTCLLCTVSTMGMLGMLQWNISDDDRVIAAHRNTSLENLTFRGPHIVINSYNKSCLLADSPQN
jgi:hypothetical protein